MNKNWLSFLAQLVSFLAVLYVNFIASTQTINGYTTGEISDMFPNKLVPANFTFAVWGVIYALVIAYLIYYAYSLIKKDKKSINHFESLGLAFILTNIINGCWMYLWHHIQPGYALILMICFLICLAYIFIQTHTKVQLSLWPQIAFESYFAWINAATVLNVTAFLVYINWGAFGLNTDIVAGLILLVLILIGSYVSYRYNPLVYCLVLAWAMFGVWKNIGNNTDSQFLTIVPLAGMLIFLAWSGLIISKDMFKARL